MAHKRQLLLLMPDFGEAGVIKLWWSGDTKWVEVRGKPYSQWDDNRTPMQVLHDGLEGWHATVLHQAADDGHPGRCRPSILMLHEGHPDFQHAAQFMEE